MTTDRNIPVRARCSKCSVTEVVEVPRYGGVALVPARLVHVQCGRAMRIISPEMKKLFAGGDDDL